MDSLSKTPRILIFGWFGHDNLGDEWFKDAFITLFPDCLLSFTDVLSDELLQKNDALIFGGGSFLDQKPPIINKDLSGEDPKKLTMIPIFFLGVGAETEIHPFYQYYLKKAKLIVLRSEAKAEYIRTLNPNVIVASDLVYSIVKNPELSKPIPKTLLILPNVACLPTYSDPYWKVIHWEMFKLEFAQFLDDLVADSWSIRFLPMCSSSVLDDTWAATEIIAKMNKRSNSYLLKQCNQSLEDEIMGFSSYEAIITQRYHGNVLANIAGRPCLTISHHDKLNVPGSISYFGINKKLLKESFNSLSPASLPLNSNIWESIANQVKEIVASDNDKMGRNKE